MSPIPSHVFEELVTRIAVLDFFNFVRADIMGAPVVPTNHLSSKRPNLILIYLIAQDS